MPWQACDHTQSKTRRKRNSEREREKRVQKKISMLFKKDERMRSRLTNTRVVSTSEQAKFRDWGT